MEELKQEYADLLAAHLKCPGEFYLLEAFNFGKKCAANGLPASEVVSAHFSALETGRILLEDENVLDAQEFLLQTALAMIVGCDAYKGTEPLEKVLATLYGEAVLRFNKMRRIKESLTQSEEKYRTLYDDAPAMLFSVSQSGEIIECNKTAAGTLGYDKSDILGRSVAPLFGSVWDKKQLVEWSRPEKSEETEWVLIKKDGEHINALVQTHAVFTDSGDLVQIDLTCRDITLRKRAEDELKKHRDHLETLVRERTSELEGQKSELALAKEQAEAASRAKSDFLARMSHEIRTPLNAVIGLTNVVLKSELTSEQRDYLNKVQVASNNLLEVINDILDFSRVEVGRLELTHEPFDLGLLLKGVADMFSNRIAAKELKLIVTLSPEVPRHLKGDAARLTQVLTNLVENAIKFTESGEIVIAVEPVGQMGVISDRVCLEFRVTDTGLGIAVELLPTLFDPFVQVDSSLTRKHEGAGLGLAICRKLVELMGGTITVVSIPDEGSTFTFTAMVDVCMDGKVDAVPADFHEKQNEYKQLVSRRVLLVEDSEMNREVAVALLEEVGLEVEIAENGRIAVDRIMCSVKCFDVVLMDIQMPVMDGYQATEEIRRWEMLKSAPVRHLPIIALTAHALKGEKDKCLRAGMDDYVAKPIDEDELYRILLRWVLRKEDY